MMAIMPLFSQSSADEPFVEFDPPPFVWPPYEQMVKQADWMTDTAFDQLRAYAEESLNRSPQPLDSICYEGHLSNDPLRHKSVEHLQDMQYLYALAWCYEFSKRDTFARQGIKYLDAWTSTYQPTGNDVNEHKLDALFLAYEIFYLLLDRDLSLQVANWIKTLAEMHIAGWNPDEGSSNRHAKSVKLILLAGRCIENKRLINFATIAYQELLEKCLLPTGATTDLERRRSMHYNVNCLQVLLETAMLIDPWMPDIYHKTIKGGGSLERSVAFAVPYIKGDMEFEEWVGNEIAFDKRRALSKDPFYQPGKIWDRSEGIYSILFAMQHDPKLVLLGDRLLNDFGASEHHSVHKILAAAHQ